MALETALMIYITGALVSCLFAFYFTEFKSDVLQYQLMAIFVMAIGWPIVLLMFLFGKGRDQSRNMR